MGRRASTSTHPFWIIATLLLIATLIAGGIFLSGRTSDPYSSVTTLDVAAYLENSNSLKDNTYKITGTIMNSIAWSPEMGRLFSIEVQSSAGSDGVSLPILIPAQFNHVNIQKGQRFDFKVTVDEKGILKAQGLQKK